MSNFTIRKAAVLGAGVMGAQIAAHLANADVPVLLFDLSSEPGPPNGIVDKALGPSPRSSRRHWRHGTGALEEPLRKPWK
jgi:3-hydroxyacyl-CoA dehydrogenase